MEWIGVAKMLFHIKRSIDHSVKGLLKLKKKSSYLHDKQFLVYTETDGGHSFSYYVGTDLWDMM